MVIVIVMDTAKEYIKANEISMRKNDLVKVHVDELSDEIVFVVKDIVDSIRQYWTDVLKALRKDELQVSVVRLKDWNEWKRDFIGIF